MASVFVAALFALTAVGADRSPPAPSPLDMRCYRLMATLAEDDDPRISAAGITGAQYFLGRIDAAAPGFNPAALAEEEAADMGLLGQCSALMDAGGRDFHALGRRLASERPTV